jgi:hypothetical protein
MLSLENINKKCVIAEFAWDTTYRTNEEEHNIGGHNPQANIQVGHNYPEAQNSEQLNSEVLKKEGYGM